MMPGRASIIPCPACGARARVPTLLSGNSGGTVFWSDCKVVRPMMPRPPWVVRCSTCVHVYWLDDVWRTEHEIDRHTMTRAAVNALSEVEEATDADIFRTIEATGASMDAERQRHLRTVAWWYANDASRPDEDGRVPVRPVPDAACLADRARNLEALLASMEGDPEWRLNRCEILRQQGHFEAALRELDQEDNPDLAWVVDQQRALCAARDAAVRPLKRG